MKYITLPQTDIKVSRVIFGAWALGGWYWGGQDRKQTEESLNAALDAGVQSFDTAPVYGCGKSESVLGEILKSRRRELVILTKCGLNWHETQGEHFFDYEDDESGEISPIYRNLRAEAIIQECEQSLTRLQTDYIDVYQFHWPDKTTPLEETVQAIDNLYKSGKIRAYGASNFSVDMIIKCKSALPGVPFVVDQEKYNLIERKVEKGNLQYCVKNDLPLLAYSPLGQGLLTGKVPADRTFGEKDMRNGKALMSQENRAGAAQALSKIQPLVEKYNCTYGNLALAWCLSRPGVGAVIAGARTALQIIENSASVEVQLEEEDRLLMSEAFANAVQL